MGRHSKFAGPWLRIRAEGGRLTAQFRPAQKFLRYGPLAATRRKHSRRGTVLLRERLGRALHAFRAFPQQKQLRKYHPRIVYLRDREYLQRRRSEARLRAWPATHGSDCANRTTNSRKRYRRNCHAG